jgi:hypothetical protein
LSQFGCHDNPSFMYCFSPSPALNSEAKEIISRYSTRRPYYNGLCRGTEHHVITDLGHPIGIERRLIRSLIQTQLYAFHASPFLYPSIVSAVSYYPRQ